MTLKRQSVVTSPQTLSLAVPAASVSRPAETFQVVHAESELLAIDELMADLTDEFVAEAKRPSLATNAR